VRANQLLVQALLGGRGRQLPGLFRSLGGNAPTEDEDPWYPMPRKPLPTPEQGGGTNYPPGGLGPGGLRPPGGQRPMRRRGLSL
jgi:hypothetical protein